MAHQVRHENKAALEHPDENGVFAAKILADLPTDAGDGGLDRFLTDEDSFNVLIHERINLLC